MGSTGRERETGGREGLGLHSHCPSLLGMCVCVSYVGGVFISCKCMVCVHMCMCAVYMCGVCACMCSWVVCVHLYADGCLHMHTFVCRSEECFPAHCGDRVRLAGWAGMVMVVGSGLR